MHPELDFLRDLAIILAVAGLVTLLFHRFKQPVVLGYILAGFIIGPHTPPASMVTDERTIKLLSELGVILLMFGLGLHFSLRKLVSVGMTAISGAILESITMFLAGWGIGRAFGWSSIDSIFLGSMLSMSSTTIIIKALGELKLTHARFAGPVFGILIIEDIIGIAILAIMSGVAKTGSLPFDEVMITLGKLAVFIAVVLVAGLLAVPPLIRYVDKFKSSEMLLVVALGLCFGVSILAAVFGYSVALGAFLIGAIIAETREHGKVDKVVEPVRDMFAAVFFVAIGMMITPSSLAVYTWPILVITAAVVFVKIIASGLGAYLGGNDARTSFRVGMCLAQIGEFSFIIASLGISLKVTSEFLYPIVVAVSAITTLLTPYLIKASDPTMDFFERKAPRWLTTYLDLYTQWAKQLGTSTSNHPSLRRLFRRWAMQIGLNMLLITGILIVTAYVGTRDEIQTMTLPDWMGGSRTVVWLIGTVLSLPLLVATLRKLRAIAMAVAELSIPSSRGPASTLPARRAVVTNMLLIVGIVLMLLWIITLTSAILPPWPVLLTLLSIVILLGGLMWQSFIRVYAKAQIQLADTFATKPPLVHEPDLGESLTPALRGAEMRTLPIFETSPAAGKLIRDLQVRTTTGASVVGIDRNDEPIVNPGPDEEIRNGDRILLLGTPEQLATAMEVLGGDRVDNGKNHKTK